MEDEREEGAIQFKFSVKYLIIILIVINLLKKSVGQWELTKCKFHIQSNMKLYICSSTLSFLSFTFTSVLRGISNGHYISHTNETLKHLVVDVLGNMLLYSVSLYYNFLCCRYFSAALNWHVLGPTFICAWPMCMDFKMLYLLSVVSL